MVRSFNGVGVVVTSTDISRLAARVESLARNLYRFEGLLCRGCEVGRADDLEAAQVALTFEVPLDRRVWVGPREPDMIERAVRRWVNRWVEDSDLVEQSFVSAGDFGEY